MLFVRCHEKRRFVERLTVYIDGLGDSDTLSTTSFYLFFFPYPYDRLWFINGMEIWWRKVDFEA